MLANNLVIILMVQLSSEFDLKSLGLCGLSFFDISTLHMDMEAVNMAILTSCFASVSSTLHMDMEAVDVSRDALKLFKY